MADPEVERAVEMREVIEGGSRAFHKPQKVSSPTGMFIADPADVESLADRSSAQRLSSHGRAISSSSYSAARMSSRGGDDVVQAMRDWAKTGLGQRSPLARRSAEISCRRCSGYRNS